MKVGDVVKYHLPTPVKKGKDMVLGIVSFFSDTVISIDCVDMTKLKISKRNFKSIELINSIDVIKKKVVEL